MTEYFERVILPSTLEGGGISLLPTCLFLFDKGDTEREPRDLQNKSKSIHVPKNVSSARVFGLTLVAMNNGGIGMWYHE